LIFISFETFKENESMIKSTFLLCGIAGSTLLGGATKAAEKKENAKPNVVILFTDDQGYGDVNCYNKGAVQTPNIDKLAQEGTLFTNFYVASAVCTPSRAGLLTGCYPQRVGMQHVVDDLSDHGLSSEEMTISSILKQNGYVNGLFGKWHLGHHPEFMPLQHGFNEFWGVPYSFDMWPIHPDPEHPYPALPLYDNEKIIEYNPNVNTITKRITEHAVDFVEKHQGEPFFLYVPYTQPHVPLGASDEFRGKSGQGLYGDAIMELDWSVGEIVKKIDELGLNENTLIIFSSDNGPWITYGDHAGSSGNLREAKGTTFGGGQKVPFVVRMPGAIPAGAYNDEMITALDILPTIMNVTKSSMVRMNSIDGVDVWSVMKGEKIENPRKDFFFVLGEEIQAVRSGKWKLHIPHKYRVVEKRGTGGMPGIQNEEDYTLELSLYDIEKDPSESVNLANQHPKLVNELQKKIEDFKIYLKESSRPVGRIKK